MNIESWLFAISIIISVLVGVKCRSKCCGKDCSFELEKEETDGQVLRSIKIGRISKTNSFKSPTDNQTISNVI